jgi:polyisoprenoid-binding protein YceI
MVQIINNKNKTMKLSEVSLKIIIGSLFVMSCFTGFSKDYRVDAKSSKLEWVAKKVTGQHTGTISFGEGVLKVEKQKITGGKLIVDMNTIVNTDLTDAGYNQKLIGHLKSDDFFGVAKFPQSTLEVKKVDFKSGNVYHFTADLTIKGITSPVEFDAEVNQASGQLTATGVLTVNRTKFGIKYGSGSFFEGLGDKMIYDDFTLSFKLVAANK